MTAHPELVSLSHRVQVLDPETFSIDGSIVRAVAHPDGALPWPEGLPLPTDPAGEPAIVLARHLLSRLYSHLFTRGGEMPSPAANALERREFLSRLSLANRGQGSWEADWTIVDLGDGHQVAVEKEGLTFWVDSDAVRSQDLGLRRGARCHVRVGKELRERQWAFYIAIGNGGSESHGGGTNGEDLRTPGRIVRLYWHLIADGGVRFIELMTSTLNSGGVPFRAKVLSSPGAYRRADAGVLYLGFRHYQAISSDLAAIYARLRHLLRETTPLLTRRLAPGLALAEDPAGQVSFGQHRCAVLAAALLRAWQQGARRPTERLEVIIDAFRELDLDPAQPELEPGSQNLYSPLDIDRQSSRIRARAPFDGLNTAVEIGHDLCRQAIWHGEACNWLGRVPRRHGEKASDQRFRVKALDVSLFAGSSGVALFLGRLFHITRDPQHRRTAIAAMRRSLKRLHHSTMPRLAFLTGQLGVLWAAFAVGELTESDECDGEARREVERLFDDSDEEESIDLCDGLAGALLVSLSLRRHGALDRAPAIERRWCRILHAWANSATGPTRRQRYGLVHGCHGIALALAEAYHDIGDRELLRASRRVFECQDSDLWQPDLPGFRGASWCSGRAGVAQARLRFYQIDPRASEALRRGAENELEDACRSVVGRLDYPGANSSVCHGLAGVGEALLLCDSMLGTADPAARSRSLATLAFDRLPASRWPSGTPCGGPNPSLLLGRAGVGDWLLRLGTTEQIATRWLPIAPGFSAAGQVKEKK